MSRRISLDGKDPGEWEKERIEKRTEIDVFLIGLGKRRDDEREN